MTIDQKQNLKMKVTGLTIDPFTNMPIVILKDETEQTALPIWIGLVEASAIATELEKVELSRPMTHDLLKEILTRVHVKVSYVEIFDLTDKTFFARIRLKSKTEEFAIDSRPSDAIAMALRCHADIWVSKKVLEKSRQAEQVAPQNHDMQSRKWTEILENLTSDDFGKYKM